MFRAKQKCSIYIDKTRIKCCETIESVKDDSLKKEVELLRTLVDEMKKKNQLLEDKIVTLEEKSIINTNIVTYADMTKNKDIVKRQTNKVPALIIKTNNESRKGEIINKIKKIYIFVKNN